MVTNKWQETSFKLFSLLTDENRQPSVGLCFPNLPEDQVDQCRLKDLHDEGTVLTGDGSREECPVQDPHQDEEDLNSQIDLYVPV